METMLIVGSSAGTLGVVTTLMFYLLRNKQDINSCKLVQEKNNEVHKRLDENHADLKDYIKEEFKEVKTLIRNNHG